MKREARLKAWQTVRKNGKWYVRGYRVDKTGQHEISFTETTFTATAERLRQLRAVLDQVRGEQLKRTEKTKMSEDKKRELKLHAIKAAFRGEEVRPSEEMEKIFAETADRLLCLGVVP